VPPLLRGKHFGGLRHQCLLIDIKQQIQIVMLKLEDATNGFSTITARGSYDLECDKD
jgi:hypothetical protein